MKLRNNNRKVAYFYTLIIIILLSIPTYFVIKLTIEKEIILNELALEKYSNKLEKSILDRNIELLRSVKINRAFYDKNNNLIMGSIKKNIKEFDFISFLDYPYIYYKKKIKLNSYGISYIITEKELNYSNIILIGTIFFLILIINIYILTINIIKNTEEPYKIIQKYTNVFFNDTMHELKTPLGVININLDLLPQNEENSKYTKRMKTALKQMQITYEDIEYYIKYKKVQYIKSKINLSSYLQERIEFFEDIANAKHIKINSNITEDNFVEMNILEIQRVLDNTISNAIKYSNAKSEIEISLIKNDEFTYLSIKDYGQGIKDTKNILERFNREDKTQGGFGIGLNIVKNICNKNGIILEIESKIDEGSTFKYKFELYKIKFFDKVENVV